MRGSFFYRALLALYPAAFRHEYGGPMELAFEEQLHHTNNRARLWFQALRDALTIAPQEHAHVMAQDIRYAFRTMAASPQFAIAAVLSLALGIGANTALYSFWDAILHASLPVHDPARLIILTNPEAQGMMNGMSGGERALLTNAEFEFLRDRASSFSELMAVESNLDRWPVRVGKAGPEQLKARFVSTEYFQVLGVKPAAGRFFVPSDEPSHMPYAVLSYDYWRNHFSSDPGVIGQGLSIRDTALTIVGIAPRGFFGESPGQQPDLWMPLALQPHLMPGRDWLHDKGIDKVMWLHSFGRLKPGVTLAQAQAEANAIFKQELELQYGPLGLSAKTKAESMDQRLRLQPAPSGTLSIRRGLAGPLNLLLAAVGVVLLIACANLASLLVARGAARRAEIALRLSLGASQARLVRQLLTESAVLGILGGLAGLGLAYVCHAGLLRMAMTADSNFSLNFDLNHRVIVFLFTVTAAAAALFGMIPAWTTAHSGAALRIHGQTALGASGSIRRFSWGRALVVAQLALSLPLIAGAGLLARTAYNLQSIDVGYPKERLLEFRLDTSSSGYDAIQREQLYQRVQEQIRRMPGVLSAAYAHNGVFTGGDSADEVIVEGYTLQGKNKDNSAREEMVGPGYFSTLGVPLLLGREINESDTANSPRVCVINEAFAKLFFAGRNPLGLQVTNVYGDKRLAYRVVGVVKDSRSRSIIDKVEQRYYVPSSQPVFENTDTAFLFRTPRDPGAMFAAVERMIRDLDPSLEVNDTISVGQRIDTQIAPDRTLALLAMIFGGVALLLAAVGLYGLLAHGVARRKGEIAVRLAIGARPGQVIAMFLRETGTLVALGLLAGGIFAYGALRLIASQLYGLSPNDPPTLALAVLILLAVALAASLGPARRAARLQPMAALRQE